MSPSRSRLNQPPRTFLSAPATKNHAKAWTTRNPTPTANVPPEPITSSSARPTKAPKKRKRTEAARRSCRWRVEAKDKKTVNKTKMRGKEKERTHPSFVALENEQLGLVDQLDPNGRQNDGRSERRVESLQRQRVVLSAPGTPQSDMLEEGRTHFADDSLKAQSRARKPECGHTEGRLPTRVKAGAV